MRIPPCALRWTRPSRARWRRSRARAVCGWMPRRSSSPRAWRPDGIPSPRTALESAPMSRAMRSIKRRALVSALTLLVAGSVVTSTPAGGGRALGAPPVHTEPVAGAVDASSPSQPDQTRANARDLYAHLRITFAGKDAFRENLLLRGPMFYEAVDRPDLAARYRELESRKNMVAFLSSLT